MELVFHKDNGLYITEFEVTSDFNVHLERSKGGKVSFYQKTTNGDYDHIEKLSKNIDKVFDYDFQALVYPKTIKITSECEFDVATLTTDGEVTEIKSQSKEVEITANGVTEIAPDAGFGYLSGVKVNVNVPQSGGSSGDVPSQPSGGSGDNIVYIDMTKVSLREGHETEDFMNLGLFFTDIKLKIMDTYQIGPAASIFGTAVYQYDDNALPEIVDKTVAASINYSQRMTNEGKLTTIGDILGENFIEAAKQFSITEEQFYAI